MHASRTNDDEHDKGDHNAEDRLRVPAEEALDAIAHRTRSVALPSAAPAESAEGLAARPERMRDQRRPTTRAPGRSEVRRLRSARCRRRFSSSLRLAPGRARHPRGWLRTIAARRPRRTSGHDDSGLRMYPGCVSPGDRQPPGQCGTGPTRSRPSACNILAASTPAFWLAQPAPRPR